MKMSREVFPPAVAPDSPVSVLAGDGSVPDGYVCPISDTEVVEAYRLMLLTRIANERCVSLQRQGRLGTVASAKGQEAAMVGSVWPLDPALDWVVPAYREMPSMIKMGFPLARLLLYYRGHPLGSVTPPGVNVLPIQIALAAQLPHAVGLGWGLRQQGSEAVVLVYFGDGAASEGDAHESLNLAGVRKAPVVFILQNNGYAISTPTSKQSATLSLASRAAGYGFPGIQVDGNDLFAMIDATREAVDRARTGGGPTLIEAVTYRLGPHNTTDDETRYVDLLAHEAWRELDPLIRVRAYLFAHGLLNDESEQDMRDKITEEIADAVAEMEAVQAPDPVQLFENVFATLTPRLEQQRRSANMSREGA